ncbi:MAG: outer membrane protein insertion porin family [Algoriphagus sp.]
MKSLKYILFLSSALVLSACSLTKNLADGEYALYENKLKGVETADKEALANLYIAEPNTRIPLTNKSLGVSIYRIGEAFFDSVKVVNKLKNATQEYDSTRNLLTENQENSKLIKQIDKLASKIKTYEGKLEFGNFLMRTGNPVTKLDSNEVIRTVSEIDNYLYNQGYLDSEVTYEVATTKNKAEVIYLVNEKQPYLIDSIYTSTENKEILNLLRENNADTHLHVADKYVQDEFVAERNRLEDLLKNNGFFMFNKSFIDYNLYYDSSKRTINVQQRILQPTFAEKHEIYTIDSISFSVNPPSKDFTDQDILKNYRGINFDFYRDRYSEKILSSRIFFQKDGVYNRSSFIETQKQLSNLDLFRFINISFDTLGTSLQAKIITQPNQKYQLTNQLGLSITEQLPGPFFSASLRNRNFFRAGEILEFNFRAGLEGVASATDQGVYQSRELGTSASVIFPRFLIPFYQSSLQKFGKYNPNTRTQLGYNYTNRPEYTRSGLNGLVSYTWATRNNRQQFTINAADLNYIRTPQIQDEFLQILVDLQNQGNNLIWSFLPSFISSISAQSVINFNQYGNFTKNSASLLRLFTESGGTTLNFLNIADNSEATDIANFQWLKFQADFRRYYPIDSKQTVAYRANFGIAQPYGISNGILPYEKYFFAGGGTSIRAWQARRLGPGSYSPRVAERGTYDYAIEQPAEMIFETMLEYRRKLFGYFDMALFIDAGNSWMLGADNSRPGADFRFDRFYKEIAFGTGIGLRMDFDFLVIRLDMATKAIDPSQPEGDRWVLDNVTFKNPLGVRGQTVLNFGIGYPF